MQGLKVQCPCCKKIYHETTEMFNPDVRPHGAMVRLLEPWKGWGWAAFDAEGAAVSTTLCSEMLCPGCTAPLAPGGRLTVIITPEDAQKIQPLNSFSDDGSKIKIPMEESTPPPFDQMPPDSTKQEESPLQESTKLDDKADAVVIPNPTTELEKKALNDVMDSFPVSFGQPTPKKKKKATAKKRGKKS